MPVGVMSREPELQSMKAPLDCKPYVQHHPVLGYGYIPGVEMTLPSPGGGSYRIQINADGIRSNRAYSREKPAGVRRILVFGDSFAAGQYVSNEQRFSEILERRNEGLEVINFGLEGTGTDQQLLVFRELGRAYEHDLVLLLPFLQNIRRNMADYRESFDPRTQARVLVPKPRFALEEDKLVLKNVPVSVERRPVGSGSDEAQWKTDAQPGWKAGVRAFANRMAETLRLKSLAYSLITHEPFPEYADPRGPEWTLMDAIIKEFARLAGEKPLVIVPLFYASYVRYRLAQNYWERFRSLADGQRIVAFDALPHFKQMGAAAVKCFFEPFDCHFSPQGHLVLAGFLETELKKAGFLDRREPGR